MDFSAVRRVSPEECRSNGRIKLSPAGEILEIAWASRPIFARTRIELPEGAGRRELAPGKELREAELASAAYGDIWERRSREGQLRAAQRARKRLFDLSMCNEFDLFITLTLDKERIDRYDMGAVVKKLNVWLDNRVRRKGLRYIIVPELHKDGAIHFHGLINSEAVKLRDSGHRNKGKVVYHVTDWSLGFTTAVKLDGDKQSVSKYISKYVTKQLKSGQKIGGRYFYKGGALQSPVHLCCAWNERPQGREVEIEAAGLTFVYVDNVTELSKCQLFHKTGVLDDCGIYPGKADDANRELYASGKRLCSPAHAQAWNENQRLPEFEGQGLHLLSDGPSRMRDLYGAENRQAAELQARSGRLYQRFED